MAKEIVTMGAGEDGAVDHRGDTLPVLSKRASNMKYEELMRISTPNEKGKTPGSPFFTAIGYFWLRMTNKIQFRNMIISGTENIPPDKGTLCTAWHTNGVIDPIEIMLSHSKRFVIGARHDLVLRPVLGWWARKFAVQPVIRKAELIRGGCTEEEATYLNGRSLRALADGISAGFGSALFPEGTSHSESHLIRLRTGPMRTVIAAAGISEAKGRPRPVLLPVGLHYRVRHHWRTDCWIEYGETLEIPDSAVDEELVSALKAGDWREPRADAVISLRDSLEERLAPMTPGAPDWNTHRAWHILGHLRSRAEGAPPSDWREEVLAARKERDRQSITPDDEMMTKADKIARTLDDCGLDGRDLTQDGDLRKASLVKGLFRAILLIPTIILLPLFTYSCGIQATLGYKFGNVTDEGLDARTTFQFLFAMFGSFLFFPPLACLLILLSHLFFPVPWSELPGMGMVVDWLILQVVLEFVFVFFLFWLSAKSIVSSCDTFFAAKRARNRSILRNSHSGTELKKLTKEVISKLST